MSSPIRFNPARGRPGAILGASTFADAAGPQYRVVVSTARVLSAEALPQLGEDQPQRVTLTTTLREADRDAEGRPRYRIDVFDQRLPFTWDLIASFRLGHADHDRARLLLDALAAALAAGALDADTAPFGELADRF